MRFFYVELHGHRSGGLNVQTGCDNSVMARALPPPITVVQRRVVVTGLGAVTPLANGMQTSWERLLESKCGIRQLRPSSPNSPQKVRGDTSAVALQLCRYRSVPTAVCKPMHFRVPVPRAPRVVLLAPMKVFCCDGGLVSIGIERLETRQQSSSSNHVPGTAAATAAATTATTTAAPVSYTHLTLPTIYSV